MRLSAKTEYACLAALELARQHDAQRPVCVAAIAERHGIPAQFLVQILAQLRSVGMVSSTRGPSGGYRLSRAPAEITLADVIDGMEGADDSGASAPSSPLSAVLLEAVQGAASAMRAHLEDISLAELTRATRADADAMYYI